MEKPFEKLQEAIPAPETQKTEKGAVIERLHTEALIGESYENAAEALDKVEELKKFRKDVSGFQFSSFNELVEVITNINKLPISKEERNEEVANTVEKFQERAQRMSPRIADLYQAILAEITNESYEPRFKEVGEKMEDLMDAKEQRSDFDVLFSGDVSWNWKLDRVEKRLVGVLKGFRDLDKREGKKMEDDVRKWREEELKKSPTRPPDENNRSRPGVDPMERLKEGERAPAIWTIQSAYDGYCKYFKEKTFSQWDDATKEWVEDYRYSEPQVIPLSGNIDAKKGSVDLIKHATVECGRRKRMATPYTHSFNRIEAGGKTCHAKQDQNGDLIFLIDGAGEVDVKIFLAPHPNKKFTSELKDIRIPNILSEFTEETNNKLAEIKDKRRGNIPRARAIASYVRGRVKYLAPKDRAEADYYNNIYRKSEKGFGGAVDEVKQADCDVENTYGSSLCARLNIPTRHCVGHSAQEDETGNLIIHSGTGHAWTEVWDEINKVWVMMDFTSAGDPNLEESDSGKKEKHIPGAFGEQEAMRPTDEQLEKLRQKLAERKEELIYTKEERQLAQGAGIELKEARQIVKEINEAEQTRLPNGELIVNALSDLFRAIIKSRKTIAPAYEGPVRKREGGEAIKDIVRHQIGVLSGETDPESREKIKEEIKEEKLFGGFDFYINGDKSGSMQSTAEQGERLWQMQRRAEYLIFYSLHRFERNIERAGLKKENALSVRTQAISFRGNSKDDIDLDKPLSPNFTAQDKVKMWHSLTEQGMDNGDPEALSYVYEQIKSEIEENKKKGIKDNRLRLVVACSDGDYVGDDAARMQMLARELHNLDANVILVGMGLTEAASAVKVVMDNPPVSHGDIARDINDLPAVVAKHLVLEAIKLFPKKEYESAKQIIENTIAKFKNIK